MTGRLEDLQKRLDRYRAAAAHAWQQAGRTNDEPSRQSFVALAAGWKSLADDVERRLNGDAKK